MSYLLLSLCGFFVFSPGTVVIACPVLFGNHLSQIRESQRQGSETFLMLKSSVHESILLINIKKYQQLAF